MLYEAASGDGPAGALRRADQLAYPHLGDYGILVSAEDVLQRLRPLDVPNCRLSDLGQGEFGRVARSLDTEPDIVQVIAARIAIEPPRRSSEAAECFRGEIVELDWGSVS